MTLRQIGVAVGLALAAAALVMAGSGAADEDPTADGYHPAEVEEVANLDVKRVTLTEDGAGQIDLQTAVAEQVGTHVVVPYAALIYDGTGVPWVYVEGEPLAFLRHEVVVDRIEGNRVLVSEGVRADDRVATVGATEVYGAELGIDGGH